MASLEFGRDADAIGRLCALTGTTLEQLDQLGRQGQARGCLEDAYEKVNKWQGGGVDTVSLLRRAGRTWRNVDGTVPQGVQDSQVRYTVGPKWQDDSCAIDVGIFCGIVLDAGRTQIDQISPPARALLRVPAAVLRRIVAKPWGILTTEQRTQLRDFLAEELSKASPTKFPLKKWRSANEALVYILDRLPQLSFTAVRRAQVCCDELPWSPGMRPERMTGMQVTVVGGEHERLSLQQAMTRILRGSRVASSEPCSRQGECTRKRYERNVCLDRFPPVLLLHTPEPISRADNDRWKLFEPLDLVYQKASGLKQIRYSPLGCVMCANKNHFLVRWSMGEGTESRIMQYDGKMSERTMPVKDWWAGLRDTTVVAVFYREERTAEA